MAPLPLMGNDILAHCSRKSASGNEGRKASLARQHWPSVRWMTYLHTILNSAELHTTLHSAATRTGRREEGCGGVAFAEASKRANSATQEPERG